LLLVGLALALPQRASSQGSAPGQIKAVRVKGEVYSSIKASGAKTALIDDSDISQGAVISTGQNSSVVLVFSNGAMVNLGTDSELDIEQFTQDPFGTSFSPSTAKAEPTTSSTHLNLIHGELVSKVVKLNAAHGSDFVVKTPVGAAGIRGTIFRIIYRIDTSTGKASFSLVTLEGRVAVTLATGTVGAMPVEVSANKELKVTADVNIDSTGNVTVALPSGTATTAATNISTASSQQVAAAAEVIAQAVANVIVAPSPLPAAAPSPPATTSQSPVIQPINPTVVSPSQ